MIYGRVFKNGRVDLENTREQKLDFNGIAQTIVAYSKSLKIVYPRNNYNVGTSVDKKFVMANLFLIYSPYPTRNTSNEASCLAYISQGAVLFKGRKPLFLV